MASKETRARSGRADNRTNPGRHGLAADDRFPPLSISIESLLQDGSDRTFRRLVHSLISFSGMIIRHRDTYGAYIGVSGPQYQMMTIIAGTPKTTVSHIAKVMSVSDQFIASEVGKLTRNNIVRKTPDEADRRSMLLDLTPKGRNLLRELGPLRRESNDLMYRSLTGDRARIMQEILDELIADAEIALYELDAPHRRGQRAPTVSGEQRTEETVMRGARRRA